MSFVLCPTIGSYGIDFKKEVLTYHKTGHFVSYLCFNNEIAKSGSPKTATCLIIYTIASTAATNSETIHTLRYPLRTNN